MIKGAIFDMDGVLLDSMPVWEEIGIIYLERQNRIPKDGLKEILFTKSMMDAAVYLNDTYDLGKDVDTIIDEIVELIKEYYETKIKAKEGVSKFLSNLKKNHVKITVATSSHRDLAEAGLKSQDLFKFIDKIFTCQEVGVGKENPKVFIEAMNSMGTDYSTTVVFEDSLHAIRTANRAGFYTIGIFDKGSEMNNQMIRDEVAYYLGALKNWDEFSKKYNVIGEVE